MHGASKHIPRFGISDTLPACVPRRCPQESLMQRCRYVLWVCAKLYCVSSFVSVQTRKTLHLVLQLGFNNKVCLSKSAHALRGCVKSRVVRFGSAFSYNFVCVCVCVSCIGGSRSERKRTTRQNGESVFSSRSRGCCCAVLVLGVGWGCTEKHSGRMDEAIDFTIF